MPLGLFSSLVDEIILISDHQIAEAIRLLVKTTRLLFRPYLPLILSRLSA